MTPKKSSLLLSLLVLQLQFAASAGASPERSDSLIKLEPLISPYGGSSQGAVMEADEKGLPDSYQDSSQHSALSLKVSPEGDSQERKDSSSHELSSLRFSSQGNNAQGTKDAISPIPHSITSLQFTPEGDVHEEQDSSPHGSSSLKFSPEGAPGKQDRSGSAQGKGASSLKFTPDYGGADGGTPEYISRAALLKILSSNLANPSQSSLDRVFRKTSRVRVYAGGELNGKPQTKVLLLDTHEPQILAELKTSLAIDEDPDGLGRDLCLGGPTIELMSGKKRLAVLGFHHGKAIRWDKLWKMDGTLKDGRRLAQWFAANGIEGPKQAMEAELKEHRRSNADFQKWVMSMPECLRPYVGQMLSPTMADVLIFLPDPSPEDGLRKPDDSKHHDSPLGRQLMSVLDGSFSDPADKVLALLQWYASGTGQWTGFPTYEELPAELLRAIPTKTIIDGLSKHDVSEPEIEGAARFFASPTFRVAKPQDLVLLNEQLKRRLLEHCLKSDDKDKRKRAELAFAPQVSGNSKDNSGH